MELNRDWITEKQVDAEYKKYVLLAYLQKVGIAFKASKLYPPLSELVEHYRTARSLFEQKSKLEQLFPKRLSGFDPQKLELQYESTIANEKMMEEVEKILEFSIPKLEQQLEEGKMLYEFYQSHINMETIGVLPHYKQEGYLFLRNGNSETFVYSYSVKLLQDTSVGFRGIHTSYMCTYPKRITNSFEYIKSHVQKKNPDLPIPAVYAASSPDYIPLNETFLPIAKRMILKEITLNTNGK